MTKIKAIETRYAGCRFRSRLEARWAVFFDALGMRWEYEPEGYMIGPENDQRGYLPDFWLPDRRQWVEVKGGMPDLEDRLKISHIVCGVDGDAVFDGLQARPEIGSDWGSIWNPAASVIDLWTATGRHTPTAGERAVQAAYAMARSARFEHGESG